MPYTITGDSQSNSQNTEISQSIKDDYKTRYLEDVDLSPGSGFHEFLVSEVMTRARKSKTIMSNRYNSWREMDHVMTAYVKLDEAEKKVREADPRKPTSLVIPVSYALREVILTYEASAFIDELPYYKYDGVGPEDVVGAALLEMVVGSQCRKLKLGLSHYTQFSDGWTYGVGPMALEWTEKYNRNRRMKSQGYNSMLTGKFNETDQVETPEESIMYEGSRGKNIDVYMYLPDPSVPASQIQDGEFVGWIEPTNRVALLSVESHNQDMFNVRYIPKSGKKSILNTDQSGRGTRTGFAGLVNRGQDGQTDVIWMYINLVPSEWESDGKRLGESDKPEKWIFGVVGDTMLIVARPLDLDHDMFPITVAVPSFDGHSASPVSGLEIISELQNTISWEVSSHVTNVRKALNDMFLVDPLMVNINDFANPGPGRLIRTRKSRWGQGVKDAVEQLSVVDVTQQHMRDVSQLMGIAQQILGVDYNMQGSINPKRERISADESKGSRSFGMSRQAKNARIIGEQCMWDAAYISAKQTQQFMSQAIYEKMVGGRAQELAEEYGIPSQNGRVSISPFDIMVDFDVSVGDRAMPGTDDPAAAVKLFDTVWKNPELAQSIKLDVARFFRHTARVSGFRNVGEFFSKTRVAPQLMPNEQVARQAQAGNLVPVGELNAG